MRRCPAHPLCPLTPTLQAYQFIFRRNVTYIAYIITGAIVLEGVFGTVSQSVWSSLNHGVSGCASAAPLHTRPLSMLC